MRPSHTDCELRGGSGKASEGACEQALGMGGAWRPGPSPRPTLSWPLPSPVPSTEHGPRLWGRGGGPAPSRAPSPRIHAEFQLSEPPDFPFWFSPGQFTGHIILSKDATHVRDFRLFVPNHRWELGPKPPAPGVETVPRGPLSLRPFLAPRTPSLGRDWSRPGRGSMRRVISSLDEHVPGAAWAWPANSVPRTRCSRSHPTLRMRPGGCGGFSQAEGTAHACCPHCQPLPPLGLRVPGMALCQPLPTCPTDSGSASCQGVGGSGGGGSGPRDPSFPDSQVAA